MKNNKKNKLFGKKIFNQLFINYLKAEASLLYALMSKKLDKKTEEVKPLVASMCNAVTAIIELLEKPEYFYNEAVMLSRSFVEKIVKYFYLMSCDSEEFNNYQLFTIQKAHRKLSRTIKVDDHEFGIRYQGEIEPTNSALLKKALEKYTSKRGREITRWTEKSTEKNAKGHKRKH